MFERNKTVVETTEQKKLLPGCIGPYFDPGLFRKNPGIALVKLKWLRLVKLKKKTSFLNILIYFSFKL